MSDIPSINPTELRLEDIIQFSQLNVERFYVKNSMAPVTTETVTVKNISNQYDVWLEMAEVEGIIPSPRSFLLSKNSSREIKIAFDVVQVNKYPEGVSRITLPIRFTSKVSIVTPEYKLPALQPSTPAVTLPAPTTTVPVPPPPLPPVQSTIPTQIPITEPPYIPPPLISNIESVSFDPPILPPPPPRIIPTEPQGTWVSGYTGGVSYGNPPSGWVQDPYGGTWYRPDDPFVLSGFGRNPEPPPQTEWIPIINNDPPAIPEPAPITTWVSAYEGGLQYGSPPSGWVQDPYGGTWYRPDDPFVLGGFGKEGIPNIPVEELQPPNTELPPPPTPINGGVGAPEPFTEEGNSPSFGPIQAI